MATCTCMSLIVEDDGKIQEFLTKFWKGATSSNHNVPISWWDIIKWQYPSNFTMDNTNLFACGALPHNRTYTCYCCVYLYLLGLVKCLLLKFSRDVLEISIAQEFGQVVRCVLLREIFPLRAILQLLGQLTLSHVFGQSQMWHGKTCHSLIITAMSKQKIVFLGCSR